MLKLFETVDHFYQPIKAIPWDQFEAGPEMTQWESGFLSGIIKSFRPKKILEVGVAEGGTTVVIQKTLEILGDIDNVEFYSIDLSERCYRDTSRACGFLFEEAVNANVIEKGRHEFLLGNYLVEKLEYIGTGIDFVILDTVHTAPGELLDLLAVMPYLKKEAMILFHDLNMDHNFVMEQTNYINKLCFDTLDGLKFFNLPNLVKDKESQLINGFPNIGAVLVNSTIENRIKDLFSCFSIPWQYIPNEYELELYKKHYMRFFGTEYVDMFENIVDMQSKTFLQRKEQKKQLVKNAVPNLVDMMNQVRSKNVYIYGCGNRGTALYEWLNDNDICISGFIVSEGYKSSEYCNNVKVYDFDEYCTLQEEKLILVASIYEEVHNNVKEAECDFFVPDDSVFRFVEYCYNL